MSARNQNKIKRFTLIQRLFHLFLVVTFLLQGATGLARMFIETRWGQSLAWVFGGYEGCRSIHVSLGIIMICGFVLHGVYLFLKIDWKSLPKSLFSPDSLVPRPKDVKDFFQHIAWFLGLANTPQFDRWGYWEKFDYWAVFWGIPVLGVTGLLLAYPLAASEVVPGWGLNVLFWIHRIEAVLAMVHVFIIHFFIAHLRRHSFPMDRAMFEGSVALEDALHEKPLWIERLREENRLDNLRVPEAGAVRRTLFYAVGYLFVLCGVFLLIGGVVNSPRVTW